jgi:short-subunit dehydrogenase
MSVSSRVVLITGASSGIGRALVLAFAKSGAHVAATARRLDRLHELAAEAASLPGQVFQIHADVTQPADLTKAVHAIEARWGRLDVVVANAGIGHRGTLADAAWDDLDAVLRTNLDGVLHTVRAAIPLLRNSGSGHIILISSVVSLAPGPYATLYAASKAALNVIARGLRMELAADHIWVTNVLLGQTHTEFAEKRRGIPGKVAGRLPTMTPEYVAARILRAADQRHRSVTLRLIDHAIMAAGLLFPHIMDRVLARVYRPRK